MKISSVARKIISQAFHIEPPSEGTQQLYAHLLAENTGSPASYDERSPFSLQKTPKKPKKQKSNERRMSHIDMPPAMRPRRKSELKFADQAADQFSLNTNLQDATGANTPEKSAKQAKKQVKLVPPEASFAPLNLHGALGTNVTLRRFDESTYAGSPLTPKSNKSINSPPQAVLPAPTLNGLKRMQSCETPRASKNKHRGIYNVRSSFSRIYFTYVSYVIRSISYHIRFIIGQSVLTFLNVCVSLSGNQL